MADDNGRPAIPAWQRSQQPMVPKKDGTEQSKEANNTESEQKDDPVESSSIDETGAIATPGDNEKSDDQSRDLTKAFLQDPAIKDEPIAKKRAFLEQKGMSTTLIDQELGPAPSPFNANDFTRFQKDTKPSPPAAVAPRPAAPPIITYPEFLSQAHKPLPLITPTRVLDTAYLASGLVALIYGASTFLVNPMSASLTEARHDFSTHSQSKLDEFNERLAKLASKVPESRTGRTGVEDEDVESVTSDPTELYHRDMGTQTSPPPSRPVSTFGSTGEAKSAIEKQHDRLAILQSHLTETLTGIESGEQSAKERQDRVNDLRHYLDTLMYRTQAVNVWGVDGAGTKSGEKEKEDAIDELKKEIRGVKGVLLSARRFAPVGGVARGGA